MPEELEVLKTITVDQFATASGIKKSRIHRLVRDKKGPPHFRVGRIIRFRVKDVEDWMKQQTNHQSES